MGTEVRDYMDFESSHLAIPGSSSFNIVDLVAPVNGRNQILTALLNPLDGTPCLHRCKGSKGFFGVTIELGYKSATKFGNNIAHLVLWVLHMHGKEVVQ